MNKDRDQKAALDPSREQMSMTTVDSITVDEILAEAGMDPLDPTELNQTFTTKHEANDG